MTDGKCLYHIASKSTCECDDEWSKVFNARCRCRGCGALYPEFRRHPIDIRVTRKPDISALNVGIDVLIGIVRIDFLELFEREFRHHLLVGRVLDASGGEIRGYATFIGQKPLAVRGGPESERRFCDECGRFVYSHDSDEYVMQASLTGCPIYEVDWTHLAITKELHARIERGRWKGIWITKLPIRDEPLDGIDRFPENYY